MEDKIKYRILIWVMVLINWVILSEEIVGEEQHPGYYRNRKIDSFEKIGDWELKFSRFRSNDWFDQDREYTKNYEWIRWIRSVENDEYLSREKIIPKAIYALLKDEKIILSVRSAWDRHGENWVKILPSGIRLFESYSGSPSGFLANQEAKIQKRKNGQLKKYIILPVGLESFSVYVWGLGYQYYIDAYVSDYEGNQYMISGGDLSHHGWKKIDFRIPEYLKMKQKKRIYGVKDGNPIRFMDFTIRTVPKSRIKDFYTYIDYFHGKTEVRYFMDLDQLRRHEFYWNKSIASESLEPKE